MKTLFLLFAVSCLPLLASAPPLETVRGHTPLEWSRKLADSEMKRLGDSLFHDKNEKARWTYDRTLFGLALLKLADATGETKYADFGARTLSELCRELEALGKTDSLTDAADLVTAATTAYAPVADALTTLQSEKPS